VSARLTARLKIPSRDKNQPSSRNPRSSRQPRSAQPPGRTSAPTCGSPQSSSPASPSVWGRTGTWSCSLPGASPGRSRRSRLRETDPVRSSSAWHPGSASLGSGASGERARGCGSEHPRNAALTRPRFPAGGSAWQALTASD